MKSTMVKSCALVLALLACSCQAGGAGTGTASPRPTATPLPTATPEPSQRSIILLALDGARPGWMAKYMENGTMPNLAALAQRGVTAPEGLQAAEPVLPQPSYEALSTGSFSTQTGLQQLPGTLSQSAGLLDEDVNATEPFWRTAMRNGLRTAAVFWPTASPDQPDTGADYMVVTAESDIPSAKHAIPLQEASGWDNAPTSFSPLREGTLRITSREGSTVATINVLALDDQDDITSTYNLLLLDNDKDLANGHTQLRLGEWAGLIASPRLHSGTRLCLIASAGMTVTLYQSRLCYNQGYPAELLQAINDKFGFPPPPADSVALRAGWLSPQQFSEMANRRAEWTSYVVLYVYQTYAPDLLLTAQTIIADYAHSFLLVDGRQEGYGPEKSELYASLLSQAHAIADDNLENLLELIDLADSALFVVSTRGLLPVHTSVNVNTILSNAKLLQVKTGAVPGQIDMAKSKAWGATAGGNTHIYVNLQGREWPGVVAPEDYAKVQEQIIIALQQTKDETGQPVFSRILKGENLDTLHMESSTAGDVFAQAAPGYYLSGELAVKKVLAPAPSCAADGFEATLPEMHGVFIAAGDGLAAGKTIPPVSSLDIAPTIAQALHFLPASTVQGHAIEGIWR